MGVPTGSTGGYEYIHTDGSVYYAESIASARAICPVLGKMAIEHVNLLLEVAAVGQQKMKEQKLELEDEQQIQPNVEIVTTDLELESNHVELTEQMVAIDTDREKIAHVLSSDSTTPDLIIKTNLAPESSVNYSVEEHTLETTSSEIISNDSYEIESGMARSSIVESATKEVVATNYESLVETTAHVVKAAKEESHGTNTESLKSIESNHEDKASKFTYDVFKANHVDESKTKESQDFISPISPELGTKAPDTNSPSEILLTIAPEVEPIRWNNVLEKEPEEIYKNFITAIDTLINHDPDTETDDYSKELATTSDEKSFTTVESLLSTESEPLVAPAIARIVIEQFNELEEETTIPLVKNIVQSVHTIDTLETQKAMSEEIKAVREELEEQVICLFEKLDIEYSPDEVRAFMAMLLHSDFIPLPPEEELFGKVNKDEGTHEVKHTFSHAVITAKNEVEFDIKHFIGMFVLHQITV